MSDNVKTIVARLARLQQFADLFQHELQEIRELVRAEFPANIVSSVSTSPEEMQAMMAELAKKTSMSVIKPKDMVGDSIDTYAKYIYGKASLLIQYLSPTTIEGGLGFIRKTDALHQYEESATDAPVAALHTWPVGFYRNATTKETQFYIRISHYFGFIYDGLPGDDGTAYLVDFDHGVKRAFNELTDEEKSNLVTALEFVLKSLIDEYGLAL